MDRPDRPQSDRLRPGPDLAGLEEFVGKVDRQAPPTFVGREAILADIEAAASGIATGGSAAGMTRLVFGAPGAGKTALLDELARRWRERARRGDRSAPLPVKCEPGELSAPAQFTARVLAALAPGRSFHDVEATTAEAGVGLAGVARVGGSQTTTKPALLAQVHQGQRTPWDAIREVAGSVGHAGPIVVLVDEVQYLAPDGDGTRCRLLAELHTARHGLPLLPVLGGLGDSPDVVAGRGISRFGKGAVHPLPLLAPEESAEAVRSFFALYRVRGTEDARAVWIRRLAEASNGWPQHLHNYLCGAAAALVEAKGDLDRADVGSALTLGDASRREYYAGRLRRAAKWFPAVHSVVARTGAAGAWEHQVRRWCREGMEALREDHDLYAVLIHDGVLQEMDDGLLRCPIPSFREYILARDPAV